MKKGVTLLSSLLLAIKIGFSAPYPLLKLTPKDQRGYILWTKLSNIFSPFYILESNALYLHQDANRLGIVWLTRKPPDITPLERYSSNLSVA